MNKLFKVKYRNLEINETFEKEVYYESEEAIKEQEILQDRIKIINIKQNG